MKLKSNNEALLVTKTNHNNNNYNRKPNWYRRSRKRPLVGPTGRPYLDSILIVPNKACKWSRKKKSDNILKGVLFRKFTR